MRGIIESESVWCTHYRRVNDPSELSHGVEVARDVLNKLASGADGRVRLFRGSGQIRRLRSRCRGRLFPLNVRHRCRCRVATERDVVRMAKMEEIASLTIEPFAHCAKGNQLIQFVSHLSR